ncbi:MAG: aldo/keto reductase [Actinomycetota bacterium]|nr:aldo/keto reductase [Actinomycetota bacterium]
MEERRLGRSGLRVSELALGTPTWGHRTDADAAGTQLRAFLAAGGTLVDTAAHFAGGRAEEILGDLLERAVPRREVVLATRAGLVVRSGELVADASRATLLDQLDASLARLGTDHVDLWQLAAADAQVPFEESLAALDHAVATGRACYVGLVDHGGWRLARAAIWQVADRTRAPIVADQVAYSLLNRTAEPELVPAALDAQVGLIAHSTLGGGLLSGKYRDALPADSRAALGAGAGRLAAGMEDLRAAGIVEAVATAAEGLGTTAVAVALGWVRRRPGVASVVVSARTPTQLTTALSALAVSLPGEIATALDEVSTPPPGYAGDAP